MAEFCVDCWNKINEKNDSQSRYILSEEPDLCEGCGEIKTVIIAEKKAHICKRKSFIMFPFELFYETMKRVLRFLLNKK